MNIPNDSLSFQVDGGEITEVPKSEWARLLRFLRLNRHRWLSVLDIIIALRTSEIPARLSQLRKNYGLPVESKPGSGRKKLYRLPSSVEVLEGSGNG